MGGLGRSPALQGSPALWALPFLHGCRLGCSSPPAPASPRAVLALGCGNGEEAGFFEDLLSSVGGIPASSRELP